MVIEYRTRFLFYMLLQSGLVRFYLKSAVLHEDLLPRAGEVSSHTHTFEVINVARMPSAYQLEYRAELSEASGQQQRVNEPIGATPAARANNESGGARGLPIVPGALAVAALGAAALAATFLLRQ